MKKIIAKKLYILQKKIRLTEEKISNNYKDYLMRCPTHLSIGQEAVASAVGLALNKKDMVKFLPFKKLGSILMLAQ